MLVAISCTRRPQHRTQGLGVHTAFDAQPFAIRRQQLQAAGGRFLVAFLLSPGSTSAKRTGSAFFCFRAPLTKACPPYKGVLVYAVLPAKLFTLCPLVSCSLMMAVQYSTRFSLILPASLPRGDFKGGYQDANSIRRLRSGFGEFTSTAESMIAPLSPS